MERCQALAHALGALDREAGAGLRHRLARRLPVGRDGDRQREAPLALDLDRALHVAGAIGSVYALGDDALHAKLAGVVIRQRRRLFNVIVSLIIVTVHLRETACGPTGNEAAVGTAGIVPSFSIRPWPFLYRQ